jgi:23S rRNA pseudouridine1911/1915/1917 synthase
VPPAVRGRSISDYRFTVTEPGTRLDKFVSEKCPEISRTRAHHLITEGHVRVNAHPARPALKLEPGNVVEVNVPPPAPSTLQAEDIPLEIVFEDRDLMVVNKPAGMTVHPAPGHPGQTLANAILAHLPNLKDVESHRPGIVHRLDKDTSGLIIVAKNEPAHMNLAEQFKSRAVRKVYLALVEGHLTPVEGSVDAGIGRDPHHRQRMAITTRGREAQTDYKVLRYIDNYSLLELRPRTGRTHQIRVHLSAIGFPVVGDSLYGRESHLVSRQFLHAHKLGFKLPSSGQNVEFESQLPADLQDALSHIGA